MQVARLTLRGGAGTDEGAAGGREPGSEPPMEEPEAAGLVQEDGPDRDMEFVQAAELAHRGGVGCTVEKAGRSTEDSQCPVRAFFQSRDMSLNWLLNKGRLPEKLFPYLWL